MRLSFDYKTQFKYLFVLVFLAWVFFSGSSLYAQSVNELRDKIAQRDADIAKLEKEINAYQAELINLGQQKNSLAVAIKELDLTKKKLNTDIAVTQNKIEKTNLTIEGLSHDIGTKSRSISTNMDSIMLGLRSTNEFEQINVIQMLLSEQGLTEAWNDVDNIVAIRDSVRKNLKELKQVKGELEDTRQETIEAKNKLTALKSELSSQQKIVIQNANEKNKLLIQTKNNEANYQTLLQDRLIQKEKFEKELEDFESQLQFVLDPSKLPNKGVLSWPLDKVFVTSPFGMRSRGFHYGTDFRATVGTRTMAMADGVVLGVGDTDVCCPGASFGKWIFIEYNNGLSSIYGHMSLISVQKGKKVKRGEVVGYTGNTGSSTGPHLHLGLAVSSGAKVDAFESKSYPGKILVQPIVAKKAYLDPMYYLPFYK